MISRREFVVLAGAAAVVRASGHLSAQGRGFDLLIRGGRVIDPASNVDGVRDVAIAGGRIASVGRDLAAGSAEIIDARGKLVVPGLIDIHTHAGRSADGPGLLLKDGVTGWIDAGSQGAEGIAGPIAVARSSPQQARVLINIGRGGILPEGDTINLANADVAAARDAIAKNRDDIIGVKARLSSNVAGVNDYEVVQRAQRVATMFDLPLMVHMGQSMSPLSKLLPVLKRGDNVTHIFAPPPNSIVDDQGKILPVVLDARRRGVLFDLGNGVNGHLRWDTVEQIMKQQFLPDTISTDWNTTSGSTGVVDFPNCLSKMLNYGMSVPQVVACATVNASKTFPLFKDRGTLAVGAPADVTLLELREGTFEFQDNYNNRIPGRQRLFPAGTVLAGKRVS
jgi:dihydroorotase